MVGVRGSVAASLLFFLSMVGVLAWFVWLSREPRLGELAEAYQRFHFGDRTTDQQVARVRRMFRYLLLPVAALGVIVSFVCVLLALGA